jgi:hypothetical protein
MHVICFAFVIVFFVGLNPGRVTHGTVEHRVQLYNTAIGWTRQPDDVGYVNLVLDEARQGGSVRRWI